MSGFYPSGSGGGSSVTKTSGVAKDVSVTFTRPNNTTPYTANKSIGTNPATDIIFLDISDVVNGNGYITKARIMTSKTGITPRLRLHLFGGSKPNLADQSDVTVLYNDAIVRLGVIDFPALSFQLSGNSSYAQVADLRLYFKTDIPTSAPSPQKKSIYAILETLDGFTPDANQEFYLQLAAEIYQ